MGGGKVFLVSLLCVAITGLLPLQAEANDTRNRVLNQTINVYQSIYYSAQLDPFDLPPHYSNITYGEKESFANKLSFNLTIYKDGFTINKPITLQDFFSTKENTYFSAYQSWTSELGMLGITTTQETITVEGVEFTKALHFNGKCTSFGYYHWADFIETCAFYPNKVCKITFGSTYSQSKGDEKGNYRLSGYYRPSLGRVIGYGNIKSGSSYYTESADFGGVEFQFYTPADDPSITISNVTTDTATISWDTNNTNPEGTSYTLQYQQLKENGNPSNEVDWGTQWHTIPIAMANSTTLKTTTQSIFSQDNTYRLRVQVNHIGGSQYNVYSDYVIFSTNTDPAVRAAYEAAIAAQAAKKAAEDGVSYALDAKTAAEDAKTAAVNAEKKSVEIYSLVAKIPPKVNKVYPENRATATITEMSPQICVDADGATHFQLSLSKTDWSSSPSIPINSAGCIELNPGVNQIYVRAYNEQIPEALRGYGTGSITIFRLQESN